jgi:lactate permease
VSQRVDPMRDPAFLAAACTAGREREIFRRVLGWSIILLLAMCAIVVLQSTAVAEWMVV